MAGRIAHRGLRNKVMSASEAAAHIRPGDNVGMSGFTGAGYPKAVPQALAAMMSEHRARGEDFRIGVLTGASTAPELDGALAEADGIELRLPYQSDPISRAKINAGTMEYIDIHLSHVAQMAWDGFLGKLDVALVEVTGINEDGELIPSSSVGNNKTWLDLADKVILEVNAWQPLDLEGMHDIYYGTAPAAAPPAGADQPPRRPHRQPTLHLLPGQGRRRRRDRRSRPQHRLQADRRRLRGRSPATSSTSSTTRCRSGGCRRSCCRCSPASATSPTPCSPGSDSHITDDLTAYTEVIQDGMLDLLEAGTIRFASATAFSLSPAGLDRFNENIARFKRPHRAAPAGDLEPPGDDPPPGRDRDQRHDRGRHLRQRQLHPRDGIGHPERHRRLGRLRPQRLRLRVRHPLAPPRAARSRASSRWSATSTTPSTTSMSSSPSRGWPTCAGWRRASGRSTIIDRCAHPDYRPMLQDYFDRALDGAWGRQTPASAQRGAELAPAVHGDRDDAPVLIAQSMHGEPPGGATAARYDQEHISPAPTVVEAL